MSATTIRAPWGAWMTQRGNQAGKQPGVVLVAPITDHAPWGAWMSRRGDQSGKQPGIPVEAVGTQRLWMVNLNRGMNM